MQTWDFPLVGAGGQRSIHHLALDDGGERFAALVDEDLGGVQPNGSANTTRRPQIRELATKKELPLSAKMCSGIAFRPKTEQLLGACDGKLRVWDARKGALSKELDSEHSDRFMFDGSAKRVVGLDLWNLTLLDAKELTIGNNVTMKWPAATATLSPQGRAVAVAFQNGDGVGFYSSDDGKLLGRLQMLPNDEAWFLRGSRDEIEIFGDVERVKRSLHCRVEKIELPLEVCEDRFFPKGLLVKILGEQPGEEN